MPTDAATGRLWVLSDLHLAPAGDQCVFRAHAALTSFIDHLSTLPMADPPQWLVLNGDVFDYLQIPGYEELSLPLAKSSTRWTPSPARAMCCGRCAGSPLADTGCRACRGTMMRN